MFRFFSYKHINEADKQVTVYFLTVLGVIILGSFIGGYRGPVFYINQTPSAPVGIYRVSSEDLERNSWVLFSTEELEGEFPETLLKEIIGIPGDVIMQEGSNIFVNGNLVISNSERFLFKEVFTLEEERFFIANKHPGSFDSRVFGSVNINLLRRVDPLWIW